MKFAAAADNWNVMIEPADDIFVEDIAFEPAVEAAVDSDVIDFTPDPAQLARPRREAARLPAWLTISLAITMVLTAVLALKPGPAAANAAASTPANASANAPPMPAALDRQDLFQLPEWHDDATAKTAAR